MEINLDNIYDYYKPFKFLEVGDEFLLRSHRFRKREIPIYGHSGCNAVEVGADTNYLEYICDEEWVIHIKEN